MTPTARTQNTRREREQYDFVYSDETNLYSMPYSDGDRTRRRGGEPEYY